MQEYRVERGGLLNENGEAGRVLRLEGLGDWGEQRRNEHGGEGEQALLIQVAGLLQGHVLERSDQSKPSLDNVCC